MFVDVASKLFLILFLNLFSNILNDTTKESLFRIKFDVSCGNIPVTAVVQFCDWDNKLLDTWNMTRKHKIEHQGKYISQPAYYKIFFRSDCGVLSRLGSYCQKEYEIHFTNHGAYHKTVLFGLDETVDLLKKTKAVSIVRKCDEELKTFTCT